MIFESLMFLEVFHLFLMFLLKGVASGYRWWKKWWYTWSEKPTLKPTLIHSWTPPGIESITSIQTSFSNHLKPKSGDFGSLALPHAGTVVLSGGQAVGVAQLWFEHFWNLLMSCYITVDDVSGYWWALAQAHHGFILRTSSPYLEVSFCSFFFMEKGKKNHFCFDINAMSYVSNKFLHEKSCMSQLAANSNYSPPRIGAFFAKRI